MRRRPLPRTRPLLRLLLGLWLAWATLGAPVAAAMCCGVGDDGPCCVASAGAGRCGLCAAPPAVVAPDAGTAASGTASARPSEPVPAQRSHPARPPWKPPD